MWKLDVAWSALQHQTSFSNDQYIDYVVLWFGLKQFVNPSKLFPCRYIYILLCQVNGILIHGAKEDGQVDGIIPHLVEGGISILQYANGTILFMEHDLVKDLNMKLILSFFNNYLG
jgi:hypothetical protein